MPDPEVKLRLPVDNEQPITPQMDANTRRHLSVITEYVKFLFDQDHTELRKHESSVMRAIKSKVVRAEFCAKMKDWPRNEPMNMLQFKYCARLTDAILTDSTGATDQANIARAIIQIGKQVYRKLNKEKQYLFTEIQNHEIWSNQSFWIEYFYVKHQLKLISHYKPELGVLDTTTGNQLMLEMAADQLSTWEPKSETKKTEIGDEEEGIVYTHIVDLVYEVIPLLVPFEANLAQLKKHMRSNQFQESSSVMTSTTYEEDDEDEGFNEIGGVASIVQKFMEKIQDRLVIDCHIRNERGSQLSQLAQLTIQSTVDDYAQINRAYRQLPQDKRGQSVLRPTLLIGEVVRIQHPAFMMADSRQYEIGGLIDRGGLLKARSDLFPAEGAIYLTNYRLLFHGMSLEYDNHLTIRSIPLSAITKVKQITQVQTQSIHSAYHHQIRAVCGDFIHFTFSTEVTVHERDRFDAELKVARFPASHSPLDVFAFAASSSLKTLVNYKFKSKTKMKTLGVGKTQRHQVLPTINEAVKSTLSNKTTLEKIIRRTGRNDDFKRLGLINDVSCFRVMKNKFMTVCQTYPPILIQPLTVSDEVMKSLAKLFKRNRIPAIVWQSSHSAILARSESFTHVSDILRTRHRRPDDNGQQQRDAARDFETWLLSVVKITPQRTGSQQSVLQHSTEAYHQSTLSINHHATEPTTKQPFVRGMANTLQQSVSTKWSSLQRLKRNSTSHETMSPAIPPHNGEQHHNHQHQHGIPRLVVLVGKKAAQRARVDPDSEVEFVACDLTLDGLRDAHKALIKTLANDRTVPSVAAVGESGWYDLVSSVLAYSGSIAALIGLEKASVLVALESGWDLTAVLIALSQVLLDGAYRTFDGIQTLIEREFLSFGHRFSHNGISDQQQAPLPVFMLFLDCLTQIVAQNTTCFQFTPFYLEVIAYHVYSGRFSTFLLDSG